MPTCSNRAGILSLLSMELDNSAFSAFLFKEAEASPIAPSSPELTGYTAPILWEICENIIRIKRERDFLSFKDVTEW